MKVNSSICIIGQRVILVPYRIEHVPIYHDWMQDPWLQKMTASDQLTLDEEYENQISWYEDPKKLTFIILDKEQISKNPEPNENRTISDLVAMAGDCNLFLNDFEDNFVAEIEVMIAEEKCRRKGLARESLALLMNYAIDELKINCFIAKISVDNVASRNLFESLGFQLTSEANIFQEISMSLPITTKQSIQEQIFGSFVCKY